MSIVEILMRSISGYIFIIPGIILYFGALRKSAKRQTPLHITTAFIFCYYLIGILTMTGMNEQKQYVCPWCGGKDVVEGIQSTYAKVQPNKALTLKGENLIHVICKNCGTVVRSYVENPQVLE